LPSGWKNIFCAGIKAPHAALTLSSELYLLACSSAI
jgi:hypothetical protein